MDAKTSELKNYIFSLKKSFETFMNEKLKGNNVTAGQTQFLHILFKETKLRQSSLSKIANCDKSYTHRVVKELLDKKLISSTEENFVLTEQGKLIAEEFEKYSTIWHNKLIENIPKKDLNIAKNVIKSISQKAQIIINNMEKK